MTTDEELVEAAKQGSADAFAGLVDRYQHRLLRFLLGRCGSRADAEDVLQDTLVNAWRYLDSYDPRWRFSTWLYRIALRNSLRRSWQAMTGEIELQSGDDPLAACMEASERENLWVQAKRCLSRDACSALWLRYAEELPVADVARALDRSLAWTKVSLMRSRRRLARELHAADDQAAGRAKP